MKNRDQEIYDHADKILKFTRSLNGDFVPEGLLHAFAHVISVLPDEQIQEALTQAVAQARAAKKRQMQT